jgi:hypothetical protein
MTVLDPGLVRSVVGDADQAWPFNEVTPTAGPWAIAPPAAIASPKGKTGIHLMAFVPLNSRPKIVYSQNKLESLSDAAEQGGYIDVGNVRIGDRLFESDTSH